MALANSARIHMIRISANCPYCGNERIRRSMRRTFFQKSILKILFIGPFKCLNCNRRFYKFSTKKFRNY